jgi:hypothetical protein
LGGQRNVQNRLSRSHRFGREKGMDIQKYQRVSSVEENRTLRFKGIRVYIEELEKLLNEDQEIEHITGSATLTPSDAYAT